MENLNDVEFGVNEAQEEAPILIAQRQLNIFRQVHIFNKAKRDQFDDELIALPDVVLNYIKKMPGGRLLIEHLEEVKTNRGISFVKSSREDFISPDNTPTTSPQPMGGVPAQYVGGSLTMDANFADTFAKSMAEAFKQMPAPTISASGAPAVSGDFGQFFEMIAEEIRSSRSSLLDVLKETKNITDSVIASQVSISRILEGILSSQNKGDSDTATMNNRIIASQASITKLLENLYTSNTQKNDEVSAYLDVDNKLQDFRNQLEQTINNSFTSIVNHIYDTTNKQAADMAVLDIEKRLATFKSELEADILKSLAQMQMSPSVANNKISAASSLQNTQKFEKINDVQYDNDLSEFTGEEELKKKKKKKKKKNQEHSFSSGVIPASIGVSQISDHIPTENEVAKVEGVIRNSEFPHEDNFNNVNLDLPPLENDNLDDIHDLSDDSFSSNDATEISNNEVGIGNNTSEIPASGEISSLDNLMDDGLDFVLPEQSTNDEDPVSIEESNIQSVQSLSSLDDLMSDGLDFTLPEQNSVKDKTPLAEEDIQSSQDLSSLNGLMNDGLDDFSEQNATEDATPSIKEENIQSPQNLSSLDDLMDNDTLSISDEPLNTSHDDQMSLDALTSSDVSAFDNSVDNTDKVDGDSSPVLPSFSQEASETPSRFSAELDKIRAALTSDNIDISSLDEPIALDDYDDDANVGDDAEAYGANEHSSNTETSEAIQSVQEPQSSASDTGAEEEWEWEYVDENGNPIPQDENNANDENWEWEYVEDDSAETEDNNKTE